ncbi:MAG: AhpC/TSA family protein [Bacteroidetes bacterium]|nr:AhpC/TSA family protein [Bacteroidota bacterium]
MFKFIFAVSMFACQFGFAQRQHHYVHITGTLNIHDDVEFVYLHFFVAGQTYIDSCRPKNKIFSFTSDIGEPVEAEIYPKYGGHSHGVKHYNDYVDFFIEPGSISITCTDSFSNAIVKAGELNKDYKYLKDLEKFYQAQVTSMNNYLSEAEKMKDEQAIKKWQASIDSGMNLSHEKVYGEYFKKNPAAPLALFALNQYAGMGSINPSIAEPLYKKLAIEQRNTKAGKDLESRIQIAKKTAIGSKALEFSQKDTAGKLISLSSFKGNYVLLNFWASWCGPCREENPGLVKVFHEYEDKDFKILSVSLDKANGYKNWINAIHADGLSWTHVSDLKFWNNAAARQYGVLMLPQNYLIDKNGVIIATNLEPEALGKKLKILLGE